MTSGQQLGVTKKDVVLPFFRDRPKNLDLRSAFLIIFFLNIEEEKMFNVLKTEKYQSQEGEKNEEKKNPTTTNTDRPTDQCFGT